jgi:hypothetical protein
MTQEEFAESLAKQLADLVGLRSVEAFSEEHDLDEVEQMAADAWAIVEDLGTDGARDIAAHEMIERLIPTVVDVKLWRALALGKNVQLPESDQYRTNASTSSARRGKSNSKGNFYGRVHTKGEQAPSEFMKRQGEAVATASKKILELEADLEAARERKASLESGQKFYATTCLLTAMRRATASVFATGPAWTVLRAISASTGDEVAEADRKLETKRILTVLHALRYHQPFERDLKHAIHAVCIRYGGEASRRGKPFDEFDGAWEYEEIIKGLEWPGYPPEEPRSATW